MRYMKNFMGYVTTTVTAAGLAALVMGCDVEQKVDPNIISRDCRDFGVGTNSVGTAEDLKKQEAVLVSARSATYSPQGDMVKNIEDRAGSFIVETQDYNSETGTIVRYMRCVNGNLVSCDSTNNTCPKTE